MSENNPHYKGDMNTHPILIYALLLKRLGVKRIDIYPDAMRYG